MVSVTVLDVERHDLSGLAACPSAGGIAAAAACSGAARMPASAAFQTASWRASSGTRLTQTHAQRAAWLSSSSTVLQ
jgi:hypothetical protein